VAIQIDAGLPRFARNDNPTYKNHEYYMTPHISQLMSALNFKNYPDFHAWSVSNYKDFWKLMITTLGIVFDKHYTQICDLSKGPEYPQWLPGAQLNIINSCFQAPLDNIAIFFQSENTPLQTITYGELDKSSNRVANTLQKNGFKSGDAIAIVMPMTPLSVAIYLGIIKAGWYCRKFCIR
jgi:acetyl-CoA synthetase